MQEFLMMNGGYDLFGFDTFPFIFMGFFLFNF